MKTTQEAIAEQQAINRKLQAMNHREQLTQEDAAKAKLIMDSVKSLDGADGETLESIIELLGMREQLTRQLFMTASNKTIIQLMNERLEQ